MHNNPYFNVFLDHIMNLYKMIEILLKYDNMRIIGLINALNCINNHIITCVNSMFSRLTPFGSFKVKLLNSDILHELFGCRDKGMQLIKQGYE